MTFDELWAKTKSELPPFIPKPAIEGLRQTMIATWNAALDDAIETVDCEEDWDENKLALAALKIPVPSTKISQ